MKSSMSNIFAITVVLYSFGLVGPNGGFFLSVLIAQEGGGGAVYGSPDYLNMEGQFRGSRCKLSPVGWLLDTEQFRAIRSQEELRLHLYSQEKTSLIIAS
jgi:hypothetical protein